MSGPGIVAPHEHDVLSGRGNFVNYHSGNEHFRALVRKHKVAYVACPKPQKGKFSKMIVDEIRSRNPPGRFLKQDPVTKLWHDIGEKKALDKTRQALREGAPEIMKELSGDTDEEGVDEAHRSPMNSSVRPPAPQQVASSSNGGINMLNSYGQDSALPYGVVSGSNMQPSRPLAARQLGDDLVAQRQGSQFTNSHNTPSQRGVSSHMSMPYGGLAGMLQQQQPQQAHHLQAQQQLQQLTSTQQQLASQQQLSNAQQQTLQQAPVLRSVLRHNSAPPLGLMQATATQTAAGLGGLQANLQQAGAQFQQGNLDSLQAKILSQHLEPTPIPSNYVRSALPATNIESLATLPPPRRVPVKGSVPSLMRSQFKRENSESSIQFDNMFGVNSRGILDMSDHKKGANMSSNHLSMMSLSMSETLDDDVAQPMRFQANKIVTKKDPLSGTEMDMSAATLGASEFGESTNRLADSASNISFSNVFDEADRDFFTR